MTGSLSFKIHRFKEIDSTNSVAFRYARQGAPAASVFVADYQTDGKGKWGRKWVSPKGKNLLFSVLLYPSLKALSAPGLTQVACRSVAKVLVERFRLQPVFKRPNDVMVKERKICGILVEAKGRPSGKLESVVVGIGLNVNSLPEELVPGATSVREETGKRQSRQVLLETLLKQLQEDLKCYF